MRAMAIVDYAKPLELIDLPEPEIKPGYVLLRILACGVCFSDYKTAKGLMPYSSTIDTSLKGAFFTSQAVAPFMIEQGKGKIVNIGSTLGIVAFAGRPVYAAAKAGLHQLTRALACEWAAQGISVNAVAPCITETPTRRNLFERPGYKEWATGQMLPIGRWAQPEDLIGATLFLCSSLSDMVVGHIIMVDGGWTIH